MRLLIYFITANFLAAATLFPACNPRDDRPAASPAPLPAAPLPHISTVSLSRALHKGINGERAGHRLPPLRWDGALARIAATHSEDMVARNYFNHITPEGQGFEQRYLKRNYACGITVDGVLHSGGENIARIPLSPAFPWTGGPEDDALFKTTGIEMLLRDWLDNSADRSNILSPHWQREGIGISVGPDGTIFITVDYC